MDLRIIQIRLGCTVQCRRESSSLATRLSHKIHKRDTALSIAVAELIRDVVGAGSCSVYYPYGI